MHPELTVFNVSVLEKPVLAVEGQCVPSASWFITYGDLSKFTIENCLQGGEWKKKLVSVTGS